MGFIDAWAAARGLRQYAEPAPMDLPGDLRDLEPELDLPWANAEPAIPEDEAVRQPAPRDLFLVCEQAGTKASGDPIFGSAFASEDEDLALSEDGYLINGSGHFLLGLTLDEDGKPTAATPDIMRLDAAAMETVGTSRITYRANLPSYPMTANADFDIEQSELLDRTLFARDPSVQASGIVLGDDRMKFLDRSLAGGTIKLISPDGQPVQLVLRWAKMTSVRSSGRDSWNLFYRVRRDARAGEIAWKNAGYNFMFGADGRLEESSLVLPIIDIMIDGVRMGNVSLIFGAGGITQFADRSGLVKVLKTDADGCVGGAFNGLSMSGRGRLFAHYANGVMRPLADIRFTGEEDWFRGGREGWRAGDWNEPVERYAA